MKNNLKRFILGIIITLMLISTVSAAQVKKTIEVIYNSVNITVNADKVDTDNILFEGTTYVPLRAISEMLGKEVGWDGKTNTASIDDTDKEILKDAKKILKKNELQDSQKQVKKNIEVIYNSVNITVNTKKVDTDNILFEGTTYVPLRAISEMLGKEVGWDGKTNTASIDDKKTGQSKEDKEELKKESFKDIGVLKAHYLDVGQGDSIFLQLPNGENALIDGGTRSNGKIVLNYLNKKNINKIDYIVATHPHEDHIGGLIEVINKFDIGKVYMPKISHTTKVFEDLLLAIKNKDKKITSAKAGDMILDKEGLMLEIVGPEENCNNSNLNNHSVVIRLNYKGNSFLFTGDAEKESESKMVSGGYNLKADVLKLGHHGSNTSTTDSFLTKVDPKYAVISAGLNNQYGHPDNSTINKLNAKNVTVFRTDLDGTIVATSDGKNITFERKGSTIKSGGSTNTGSNGENTEKKSEVKPPATDNLEEVYISKTGTKYHRGNCTYLKNSKIPISLKEARKGYGPCTRCNPPN